MPEAAAEPEIEATGEVAEEPEPEAAAEPEVAEPEAAIEFEPEAPAESEVEAAAEVAEEPETERGDEPVAVAEEDTDTETPGEPGRGGMTMAKMTTQDLLSVFEEMTVLELKDFLDAFEERFEVTAAAPMAVAAAPVAGGDGAAAARRRGEGRVRCRHLRGRRQEDPGDQGGPHPHQPRASEAKELVESAPKAVLEAVDKEAAEKAKEQLEGAGATVELR